MIDIHSPILPGVDDGASSMKESLHMLSMARRQGITDVFATSHYSKAFPNRDPEKLRRLRDELMSRANRPVQGPEGKVKCKRPIRIWTGQEIFYSNSVIRLLEEGKLLTLADSNYVLVELCRQCLFRDMYSGEESVKSRIYSGSCSCGEVSLP